MGNIILYSILGIIAILLTVIVIKNKGLDFKEFKNSHNTSDSAFVKLFKGLFGIITNIFGGIFSINMLYFIVIVLTIASSSKMFSLESTVICGEIVDLKQEESCMGCEFDFNKYNYYVYYKDCDEKIYEDEIDPTIYAKYNAKFVDSVFDGKVIKHCDKKTSSEFWMYLAISIGLGVVAIGITFYKF